MWSKVERKVNEQPHNSLTFLRTKISEVMEDIDREVIILAYKKFCPRIEAVVEANGDFIE